MNLNTLLSYCHNLGEVYSKMISLNMPKRGLNSYGNYTTKPLDGPIGKNLMRVAELSPEGVVSLWFKGSDLLMHKGLCDHTTEVTKSLHTLRSKQKRVFEFPHLNTVLNILTS